MPVGVMWCEPEHDAPRRPPLLKRDDLDSERINQIVADARKAGYDFFLTQEEREASLQQALARYAPGEEAWIFAYGSLMWNPALEFAEASACHVEGWRRSAAARPSCPA